MNSRKQNGLVRVYEYKTCSTCQKAIRFLAEEGVEFERIAIVESPPTERELREMLVVLKARGGTIKSLFNISGQVYREMKIGDRFAAGLSEDEALSLLASNGKLIKRPFLIAGRGLGAVGFREEEWRSVLGI